MEGEPEVVAWVEAARSGDGEAFRRLHGRFAPSVHAVALARAGAADADDLVQEAFLAAHRRLGTLREPGSFGPWLLAIARNAAADLHRRRAARPREVPLPEEGLPAPPAADGDGEFRRRVLAAIGGLPEAYRETLLMRLAEGMTGPAIAAATGLTHGSVRVNLHRGMELLRERLGEEAP